MKDLKQILEDDRIRMITRESDNDKVVQLLARIYINAAKQVATVKFTKAIGWEHLSVSFEHETPSWDCMQEMKEMFWEDNEVCFQLHPAKDDYVNNHEHCLHLWRSIEKEIPTPPSILVGFRKGKESEDKEVLKQLQIELGSPLSEDKLDFIVLQATDPVAAIEKMHSMPLHELIKLL